MRLPVFASFVFVLTAVACAEEAGSPSSDETSGSGGGATAGTGGASSSASGTGGSGASGGETGAGGVAGVGGGAGGGAGEGAGGTGGSFTSPCPNVTADYGACDTILGWGFDGNGCSPFKGCSCDPNCADMHVDLAACSAACGPGCDSSAFVGLFLGMDGWGVGTHCDDVSVCADAKLVGVLEGLHPGLFCEPTGTCGANEQSCTLFYSGTITQQQHDLLCALTFVSGVDELYCAVYGP